jgi:hypothetical protein
LVEETGYWNALDIEEVVTVLSCEEGVCCVVGWLVGWLVSSRTLWSKINDIRKAGQGQSRCFMLQQEGRKEEEEDAVRREREEEEEANRKKRRGRREAGGGDVRLCCQGDFDFSRG